MGASSSLAGPEKGRGLSLQVYGAGRGGSPGSPVMEGMSRNDKDWP